MSKRGPYAKGVAKRAEILDAALDVIGRKGFSGATVKELADAVGLSQNGLLHYFGSREELFAEVLRHRDKIDTASLSGVDVTAQKNVIDFVIHGIRHNAEVPGLVRLYSQLAADASVVDHPIHRYFQERFSGIRTELRKFFETYAAEGALPTGSQPDDLAIMVLAMMDGLQTLWLYDNDLDMASYLERFFETMGLYEQTPRPA